MNNLFKTDAWKYAAAAIVVLLAIFFYYFFVQMPTAPETTVEQNVSEVFERLYVKNLA